MKFYDKQDHVWAERQRAMEAGCKSCGKMTHWLVLKGSPGLTQMLRSGASQVDLDGAMEERGWYCRACMNTRARKILTAATTNGLAATVMNEPPLSEQEKKDAHQRKLMAQCKAENQMPEGYTVGPDGLHWVEIKRSWSEDAKWEYIHDKTASAPRVVRAHEVYEGEELEAVLQELDAQENDE